MTEVQKWSDNAGNSGELQVFNTNPFELLQQTMNRVNEFQQLIKGKLDLMANDETEWRYTDKAGAEQLRSEVTLYERALDRAVRAATAISKLNIEERYLAISEKQAASIIYIIDQVLTRLELSDLQREQARVIVGQVIEEMLTQPAKGRHV